MALASTRVDWKLFDVVQAVYLLDAPLFDVEDWVTKQSSLFTLTPASRKPNAAALFLRQTVDEAYEKYQQLWVSQEGGYTLHLLPAMDVLEGRAEQAVARADFPMKWDPDDILKQILGGLVLADTKLTGREKEAWQLRSMIGLTHRRMAQAMNISDKCAGTHLSNGWKAIRENRANLQVMRWFVENELGGHFPTKNVTSIEEEMEQDAMNAADRKTKDKAGV